MNYVGMISYEVVSRKIRVHVANIIRPFRMQRYRYEIC